MAFSEALAERIRQRLARRKNVEEKKMFGGVGFLLGGNMLALLLENVGMDAAVSLGDPALWKQAIDERLKAQQGPRPEGVKDG